ncbi:hypothetical protein [Pendulispora albinea]|uniref:Uncharacterized protein n=1 Tax=Pendulispora albinea TaxID=2741071 RepID=A0ABZ2LTD3_9BACT
MRGFLVRVWTVHREVPAKVGAVAAGVTVQARAAAARAVDAVRPVARVDRVAAPVSGYSL